MVKLRECHSAAVLPAPPSLPCGQPQDLKPLDALLFLWSLEAGLCVYLKILSTPTKQRHLPASQLLDALGFSCSVLVLACVCASFIPGKGPP